MIRDYNPSLKLLSDDLLKQLCVIFYHAISWQHIFNSNRKQTLFADSIELQHDIRVTVTIIILLRQLNNEFHHQIDN